jgi:hypothetical protein
LAQLLVGQDAKMAVLIDQNGHYQILRFAAGSTADQRIPVLITEGELHTRSSDRDHQQHSPVLPHRRRVLRRVDRWRALLR